jgi:O-antigen/teichoic acid export membrane protein
MPRVLLRNLLSVALGNYGAIGLGFLLSIVLTHRLGALEFGRLALLIMSGQVLTAVVAGWSVTGLVRFASQEFARHGSIAQTFWARGALLLPGLTVVVAAAMVVQAPAARYLGIPERGIWVVAGFFVVTMLAVTIGAIFQARQQMDRYAISMVLDKALALIAILLLPAPYASSPVAVVACYAASTTVVVIWGIASLGVRALMPVRVERRAVADLWRFSAPLVMSTWIGIVGGQAVMYALVRQFRPMTEVGLYALSSQIAAVLQQIAVVAASVLLPRLSVMVADGRDGAIKRRVEELMPYGLLAFALLLCSCTLFARPVIAIAFGPGFTPAATPLALLLVAAMLFTLSHTLSAVLSAYGRTWELTGVLITSAVVNVGTAWWLVPTYGMTGAAMATIGAYATSATVMLVAFERRLGIAAVRFGMLALPVAIAALCAVTLDGALLYLVGMPAVLASASLVALALGLFKSVSLISFGRAH